MRIPSDNPTTTHTARSGALQALGLRPGQTFTAQVISHTPEGLTNLQVGSQSLSLALPSKAQIGVFLQFEFQSGGAKPQITLLGETNNIKQDQISQKTTPAPQTAQQQTISKPTAAPPNPSAQPNQSNNSTPQQSQSASQTNTQPISASPPQATTKNPTPNQIPNSNPNSNTSEPPKISVPIPPATKTALKLYPSQFVSATVTGANSSGQTILHIGQQQFLANIPNKPSIGVNLTFQVQINGENTRLILSNPISSTPAQSSTKAQNTPNASNLTGSNPSPNQNAIPSQNPVAKAISQAIPANIAKQDSMALLFTNLMNITKEIPNLPPNVVKAAQQLQNAKINFDNSPPSAQNIQTAIKQSGVFMEAILATAAQAPNNVNTQNPISLTTTKADLKILLLLFRNSLTKWLGEQSGTIKPDINRPNPPIKGAVPRSNAPTQQTSTSGQSTQNIGQTLLSQTDAALSRLRLFQMTSLPEANARTMGLSSQETNLEIPFVYNGETNLIRFQISRDASEKNQQKDDGWQLRFSMNLKDIGEVGADVAFRFKKINATIWAAQKDTANSLEKMLPLLNNSLLEKNLELGSIHIRHGAPKPPPNSYGIKS